MDDGPTLALHPCGVIAHKLTVKNLEFPVNHHMPHAQAMGVEQIVEGFGRYGSGACQEAADIDRTQVCFGAGRETAQILSSEPLGGAQGCAVDGIPNGRQV